MAKQLPAVFSLSEDDDFCGPPAPFPGVPEQHKHSKVSALLDRLPGLSENSHTTLPS